MRGEGDAAAAAAAEDGRPSREISAHAQGCHCVAVGRRPAALATPVLAKDIPIAVAGPMTGPLASIGDQMKRGAEAAAAAINEAGGVNGKKIKIVVEDDVCDPKQAVAVANLIVGQQIKFVDGHACSGSSIPASEVYAENNILMMSPASSNPMLTEKGFPTILRLYPRDDAQGAFVAPWIVENFKGKKIAILHDKSAYGKGVADRSQGQDQRRRSQGGAVRGPQPGRQGLQRHRHQAERRRREFVYFGGYHPEAGLIIRQAADQGYKPQLMSPRRLSDLGVLADLGTRGRRCRCSRSRSDPRRSPAAAKAMEQFKAQGYTPEGFTLISYARVNAIADGIKKAGSDDPKAVAKALEDGQPVETVMGPVKLDSKGDIKDPRYDINEWKEGKYAPIAQ